MKDWLLSIINTQLSQGLEGLWRNHPKLIAPLWIKYLHWCKPSNSIWFGPMSVCAVTNYYTPLFIFTALRRVSVMGQSQNRGRLNIMTSCRNSYVFMVLINTFYEHMSSGRQTSQCFRPILKVAPCDAVQHFFSSFQKPSKCGMEVLSRWYAKHSYGAFSSQFAQRALTSRHLWWRGDRDLSCISTTLF